MNILKLRLELSDKISGPRAVIDIDTSADQGVSVTGKLYPADWKFVNDILAAIKDSNRFFPKAT